MLVANPTKNGYGIQFWGDYNDIRCLYDIMSELSYYDPSSSPASKERNERLLTIVPYEARHAYQEERLVDNTYINGNGHTTYFGFEVDWITIIFTYAALRYNAGHQPTDEITQSYLYQLKFWIRDAMRKYDPVGAQNLEQYLDGGLNVSSSNIYIIHQELVEKYNKTKAGKLRFRSISSMLDWANEKMCPSKINHSDTPYYAH